MFPTLNPLNFVPVTPQYDPAKVRPEVPPVAPVQASSSDSTIDMRQRDHEEAAQLLREAQRRLLDDRQERQGGGHDSLPQGHGGEPRDGRPPDERRLGKEVLNADNTVPVVAIMDEEPRQGLLVDIQV